MFILFILWIRETQWAKTLYLNLPFEIIVLVQYVKCLYFVFIVIKCRDITDLFSLSYNVDMICRNTIVFLTRLLSYKGKMFDTAFLSISGTFALPCRFLPCSYLSQFRVPHIMGFCHEQHCHTYSNTNHTDRVVQPNTYSIQSEESKSN